VSTGCRDVAGGGREKLRRTMRIGIDLGGTKIEAIALDEDGSVLLRERIAAPRGDYEATVDASAANGRDHPVTGG
jgi:predicted NBD/HSP70 family sugar kinase